MLGINKVQVCSLASTQTNGVVDLVANFFRFWLVLKPVSSWVAVGSRPRREFFSFMMAVLYLLVHINQDFALNWILERIGN